MSGRTRHSDTPLAELLADTVQRELTVSSADGLCPVCATLVNQCDKPSPLQASASQHLRNIVAARLGETGHGRGVSRRKRGRPLAKKEPAYPSPWANFGTDVVQEEWTPVLDVRHGSSRPRPPRTWASDDEQEPSLEQLTDLTVPSETKRSARIAIRRNAYVATAVHATSRPPRVIVIPDMQAKYRADPNRPPRRTYHRSERGKAKGRRGRPKLPNPPENQPIQVVEVSSDKPPGMDGDGAPDQERVPEEHPPAASQADQETGPVHTDAAEANDDSGDDEDGPPRTADPDCPCIMCAELTAEQRQQLAAATEFSVVYVCQICHQEMTGRSKFREHERRCKLRRLNPRRIRIVHECSTCKHTFKSARLRDEHYTRTGHEKRSPCPVCQRFFHPDFLRIHLNSHSGAFRCKVCDTHFSSQATLRGHMYRHSGLKPHKCDVCGVAFRTPSSLFMHKRYHHSTERPYTCNFCPKGFAARSTLRIHLRQHTGERPFVCKLCGKSYTRKSSLTQHLRSHTQERRHVCMTCGKRFDNKTYLTVHMNRHLGVRAHRCERCDRGFFSRPNLLKHMQVICYKNDYGQRPAAGARQMHMQAPAADGEDIQTTEVILAIESIPDGDQLLVGHLES
ncbi:zinc finger protein 502-like [Pollicipes pollicipes]|uniref:zinc finger protein 502-like n=1 Tax=Pollicipes pollicipes TaxID=41117 RepID=UPI001884EF6A|nr:zinc finger protein 502-like [Pollicipes pollicipes]